MADSNPFDALDSTHGQGNPFDDASPNAHAGMSHNTPAQPQEKPGAPMWDRFTGGVESGLLEANKLAAKFGLWLGHPGDKEDLANAIKLQDEHEARVKEMAPSGPDIAHMAGEVANPLNFIGPAGAIRGAGWGANILRGVIGGAQGGLLSPTKGADVGKQKLEQAAAGAAGGAVTAGIIPEMSPEASLLVNEGVRLTPAQKAGRFARWPEEAVRSFPVTGYFISEAEKTAREDFNRAIYNRVLQPIGQRYNRTDPVGSAGIDTLRSRLDTAYDRALTGTQFIANPAGTVPHGLAQGSLNDLNNILSLMTNERRNQFNSIINQFYEQRVPANRVMDARTFKRVESELGAQERRFSAAQDPDQQSVGDAIAEVRDLLREAHAAQNPQRAAELQAANRAYARYVSAERGSRWRVTSDGVMTPADFLGGLAAMDASVRRNRFARGVLDMQDLARAGNMVLTNRLGDSGTATRTLFQDAIKAGMGAGSAEWAGVSPEHVGEFLAGLGVASVPYMRLPPGLPTANLGTRVGRAVDPVVQQLAPGVGQIAGGAVSGMEQNQ